MQILKAIVIFAFIFAVVPLLTVLERKLLGRFQARYGPNRVGPYGLMQPLADALKLVSKEQSHPATAVPWMMALAPVIIVTTAVATLAIIPFGPQGAWGGDLGLYGIDVPIGLLYFFAFGSLAFYAFVLGGWASGSKYSFLGRDALRGAADLLRGGDRPVAARRGDDRRLALAGGHRGGAGRRRQGHLVRGAPVRGLPHLHGGRLRRGGPGAVRPARSPTPSWWRATTPSSAACASARSCWPSTSS